MQHLSRKLLGVLAFLALAVSVASLQAQSTYGAIEGTVTDPTGAAIPGARVEARNQDTNDVRDGETDSQGIYVFPNPAPGSYTIAVTSDKFAPGKNENIQLQARVTATSDVQLQLVLRVPACKRIR
jgi:hypothetical protein